MKTKLKFLLLFLVLALALSAFVGCNNAQTNDETLDLDDEEEDLDYLPDIDKKDYNDDLNVYIASAGDIELYVLDESDGSPMDEAVYARQERVKRYLGVNMVTYEPIGYDWQTYAQVIANAITNKDGTVDVIFPMPYAQVTILVTENYLMDWLDVEGVDLSAEYWNL